MTTGQVLEEQSYNYVGPVAQAFKSKSKKTTVVQRDPLEQELAEMRLAFERSFAPTRTRAQDVLSRLLASPFGGEEGGAGAGEPSELERIVQRQIEGVAAPAISASLSAAGMGRGGAGAEALSRAGLEGATGMRDYLTRLADPSSIFFAPARTTTETMTQRQGFGAFLPSIFSLMGSATGGAMLGGAGGLFGSMFGGGSSSPFGMPYYDPYSSQILRRPAVI